MYKPLDDDWNDRVKEKLNTRDYSELINFLMERYCLEEKDIVFVENIADWCKENGIPEPDRKRPVKFIAKRGYGCKMLVAEYVPEEVLRERITALEIRSQLKNVASDRADLLNSDKKKFAYLLLREFAGNLADIVDEQLADDWVFDEMEEIGFFKN